MVNAKQLQELYLARQLCKRIYEHYEYDGKTQITLDGDALVQEGLEKQQELKDELNATLDKVNNVEMMRGDAELAQAVGDQYATIPFPAPFLSMA